MAWMLIIGAFVAIGWHGLLRFSECQALQWSHITDQTDDEAYCIRLRSRKTHQRDGDFVMISKLDASGAAALAAEAIELLRQRRRPPSTYLFPDISARGAIDPSKPITYEHFRKRFQEALSLVNADTSTQRFTTHSLRAGGATAAYLAGLPERDINLSAGVVSLDWISGYYGPRSSIRTRTAQAFAIGTTHTTPILTAQCPLSDT